MATRSYIGIKNENEKVDYIYCHWDGYPTHHGPILIEHYQTKEQVDALLNLGDVSILGEDIDKCVAYGRDKGESNVEKRKDVSLNEVTTNDTVDYTYIFDNNKWLCYHTSTGALVNLYK